MASPRGIIARYTDLADTIRHSRAGGRGSGRGVLMAECFGILRVEVYVEQRAGPARRRPAVVAASTANAEGTKPPPRQQRSRHRLQRRVEYSGRP